MDFTKEVEELRKRLEGLEQKISDSQNSISIADMRARVAEMDPDPKWKAFVLQPYGVVDNIVGLLDDSHEFFLEAVTEDAEDMVLARKQALSILGKTRTKLWFEFQLSVIKKLLDPKDYDEEYNFEDTAGGCDEVAWDAGYDLLKEKFDELNNGK
jgi:hypothetical protein